MNIYAISDAYGAGTITNTDYIGVSSQNYCDNANVPPTSCRGACKPPSSLPFAATLAEFGEWRTAS
jgi:hypothetical protein